MGNNIIKLITKVIITFNIIYSMSYAMDSVKDDELDQQIGQLLIVGFKGKKPDDDEPKKICSLLKQQKLGGVILYGHNIENPDQLLKLTGCFSTANPKAFIAVDQEGGAVQRLISKKGFQTSTANAEEMSRLPIEQCTELYGLMADELRKYLFNINFGPVVDLNNPERPSPAIGKWKRSYGNDPEAVSTFAKSFVEAHRKTIEPSKQGIACALKHFPGHGYSTEDSHFGVADTTKTAVPEQELLPYQFLIGSGHADMIMTAHIVNMNYDSDGHPATLSSVIIPNFLRKQLGYSGVVVTDDLHMGAITQIYQLDEVVTRALNATCDLLIFSNNSAIIPNLPSWKPDVSLVENVIGIVRENIQRGKIPTERILESHKRLKILKAKIF
jgi:beta-N-acetylhexosaminidase